MRAITVGVGLFVVLPLIGQTEPKLAIPPRGATVRPVKEAVAVIHAVGKSGVSGIVRFVENEGIVQIRGEVTGLKPGAHGFHVHEFGDCSAPDASSAGGHFNPSSQRHGGPKDVHRHVGDLGNIQADESGRAVIQITDRIISLNGPQTIVGRALIIHDGPDDLKSQPSGAAGARVGCGVIGVANPGKAPAKEKK